MLLETQRFYNLKKKKHHANTHIYIHGTWTITQKLINIFRHTFPAQGHLSMRIKTRAEPFQHLYHLLPDTFVMTGHTSSRGWHMLNTMVWLGEFLHRDKKSRYWISQIVQSLPDLSTELGSETEVPTNQKHDFVLSKTSMFRTKIAVERPTQYTERTNTYHYYFFNFFFYSCFIILHTCAFYYEYNTTQYTKQNSYENSLKICNMKKEKTYNTLWTHTIIGWTDQSTSRKPNRTTYFRHELFNDSKMSVFPKISTKGNQNSRICRLSQAKEISEGSQSRCIKKCAANYSHFLGADSSDAVRDLSNSRPSLIDHVCETCQHTPCFHTDIYAHQDKNGSMPVCFRQAFSGLPSKQYFEGDQVNSILMVTR